ncbi:hypothetical protein AB0C74_38840 [Spirillospora sp. NPDC048832]
MPRFPPEVPDAVLGDVTDYLHLVTVMFDECECDDCCAKAEADPDAEPDGTWVAACGQPLCGFVVEAPSDRFDALWLYAERHEADPQFGLGVDYLPDDAPAPSR